jgi:hypothetical protein
LNIGWEMARSRGKSLLNEYNRKLKNHLFKTRKKPPQTSKFR